MNPKIIEATCKMSGIKKINMLRQLMRKEKIDAFLIPRADCHQGEFISENDARLTWLSGFTGSAGLCIVTLTKVGLFVDGRYSIQAENEKNCKYITVLEFETKVIFEWLRLTPGIVAFDPWLHTIREIGDFRKELKGSHKIQPISNLIDKIWTDKPKEDFRLVYKLSTKYAGVSHQEKISNVSSIMKDSSVDFVIYTLPDSICWLLNIRGKDIPNTPIVKAFAIQNRNSEVEVYLNLKKIPPPVVNELEPKIKFFPTKGLITRLRKLKGTVWLDSKSCSFAIKKILTKRNTLIHDSTDPCSTLKAIKNASEITGTRLAHQKDGIAMVKFLHWFSINVAKSLDEISIIESLEKFREKGEGYQGPSFDTICGAGPNGAIIHYRSSEKTNRILKRNDILLIDSGGQYLEGTTDITRTISVGKNEKRKKKHFTLVLKGMIAISKLKWPIGLSGRDLDSVARYYLWQEGLDYEHGTGHGVGSFLSVHEGPQAISRRNEIELKPGMLISNEPGYYVSDNYGIRIENLLLVKTTPTKFETKKPMLSFETITLCPIDKSLILPDLLTNDEIKWLNDYHSQVKQKLADKLEPKIQKWLIEVCSPL